MRDITGDSHIDYVAEAKAKTAEARVALEAEIKDALESVVLAERERIINLIVSWEAPIPNRRALCLAIRNGEDRARYIAENGK